MPNFGGFSTNRNIASWLDANTDSFVLMVTSYSALLSSFQTQPAEPIRIAKTQVFPRIGLILGSARDLDNAPLFSNYDAIIDLMTETSSVVSEGITQVAAAMTAAILIKRIPLNADIKNIDLGSEIEKGALADLDRIITLYKDGSLVSSVTSKKEEAEDESKLLFFALDVNPATLPEAYFDVGKVIDTIDVSTAYPSSQPAVFDALTIPPDQVAFGQVQFSSLERLDSTISIGNPLVTSNALEQFFFVKDGSTAGSVAEEVSEALNSLTLSSASQSNIIANPNFEPNLNYESVRLKKRRIYPNAAEAFKHKVAQVTVSPQYSSITFQARRISPIVSRELIILKFYSASKTLIAQKKTGLNVTFTYKGVYSTSTTYSQGDIVDSPLGTYVYSAAGAGANIALTNAAWTLLFASTSSLNTIKDFCNPYINGLLFGAAKDFSDLETVGPRSLTLIVENANVKANGTTTTTGGSTKAAQVEIDTFYFKTPDAGLAANSTLLLRIASVKLTEFPALQALVDANGCLVVDLNAGWDASNVALAIVQKLYQISQFTDVLGGLVHPNAVQITAFKKTAGEVKEVVDVLAAPLGLEIATGSVSSETTQYKERQRSVIVTAQALKDNLAVSPTTTETFENNKDYGVVQASRYHPSERIQSVYDKINLLNKRRS